MAKNQGTGKLADVVSAVDRTDTADGLTAAEICLAYKAALSDFVHGRTNRKAIAETTKLLSGALAARKQKIAEEGDLTSMRCHSYFYNN